MKSVLSDFWFWLAFVEFALLIGTGFVVRAYKRATCDAVEQMEEAVDFAREVHKDFPSIAEMRAEYERLRAMQRETCHDKRCPGMGTLKHKCHDLDCKAHPHTSRAIS